jgi:hypothetical protein
MEVSPLWLREKGLKAVEMVSYDQQCRVGTLESLTSKSCPAGTKGLGGVATKATNVGSNHRDLEQGGEVKHLLNLPSVLLPGAQIVTKPLADVLTGSSKGGSSNDKRTTRRSSGKESEARSSAHHGTVEVVHIELNVSIVVDDISVEGEVGQTTVCYNGVLVVNLVRRTQVVSVGISNDFCLLTLCERSTLRESTLGVGCSIGGEPWRRVDVVVSRVWRSAGLELSWEAGNLARLRAKSRACRRETTVFGRRVWVVVEVVEVGSFVHVDPEGVDVNAGVGIEE